MAGRKLGAALISKNISQHILTQLGDKPGNWRPLIYCWRGGQRSRSLAIILRQIGYEAHVLMVGAPQCEVDITSYSLAGRLQGVPSSRA